MAKIGTRRLSAPGRRNAVVACFRTSRDVCVYLSLAAVDMAAESENRSSLQRGKGWVELLYRARASTTTGSIPSGYTRNSFRV